MFFTSHSCSCVISPVPKPLSPLISSSESLHPASSGSTPMKEPTDKHKNTHVTREASDNRSIYWDHAGLGRWVPTAVPAPHCKKGGGHIHASSPRICSSRPGQTAWPSDRDSPLHRGQSKCTSLPGSKKVVFGRI